MEVLIFVFLILLAIVMYGCNNRENFVSYGYYDPPQPTKIIITPYYHHKPYYCHCHESSHNTIQRKNKEIVVEKITPPP